MGRLKCSELNGGGGQGARLKALCFPDGRPSGMEEEEESGFSQRLIEAQTAWNSAADADSVATPLRWLADNASPAALSLGQQEVRVQQLDLLLC